MVPDKPLHFPKLQRRLNYSNHSTYRQYRQEIREDCLGRCIYCDLHENELGGSELMTLDHFRPKDKYPTLKHNPENLVWSCSKCNHLKANFWPGYGTSNTVFNEKGYIDPFADDPHNYFEVQADGELKALKPPARYMIKNLLLNRNGAKRIRESRNKKYEAKIRSEEIFNEAINYMNVLLANPNLSEQEREAALKHKNYLEGQYEVSKESFEIDFNLY